MVRLTGDRSENTKPWKNWVRWFVNIIGKWKLLKWCLHAYSLDAESKHSFHVRGTRNDKDIVNPYSAKCRYTDRPCRPWGQYRSPGNGHSLGNEIHYIHVILKIDLIDIFFIYEGIYLITDNLINNASLNVSQFLLRYPWMRGRRVEGEQVPNETPKNSDASGRVEDIPPAAVSDDKSTQEVGYPDAETEPLNIDNLDVRRGSSPTHFEPVVDETWWTWREASGLSLSLSRMSTTLLLRHRRFFFCSLQFRFFVSFRGFLQCDSNEYLVMRWRGLPKRWRCGALLCVVLDVFPPPLLYISFYFIRIFLFCFFFSVCSKKIKMKLTEFL